MKKKKKRERGRARKREKVERREKIKGRRKTAISKFLLIEFNYHPSNFRPSIGPSHCSHSISMKKKKERKKRRKQKEKKRKGRNSRFTIIHDYRPFPSLLFYANIPSGLPSFHPSIHVHWRRSAIFIHLHPTQHPNTLNISRRYLSCLQDKEYEKGLEKYFSSILSIIFYLRRHTFLWYSSVHVYGKNFFSATIRIWSIQFTRINCFIHKFNSEINCFYNFYSPKHYFYRSKLLFHYNGKMISLEISNHHITKSKWRYLLN